MLKSLLFSKSNTSNTFHFQIWLLHLCVLTFFSEPIVDTINTYSVVPIFSKIEKSILKDVSFFIVLPLIAYVLWIWKKNYEKSLTIKLYSTSYLLIYVWQRQTQNTWTLVSLESSNNFYYADVILMLALIYIFPIFKFKEIKRKNRALSLVEDIPLTTPIDSHSKLLERYASRLYETIKEAQFEQSFVIGINARWGNGKSTFLNFLKLNIKNNESILVEFNPWKSASSKDIEIDFYTQLAAELGKQSPSLSNNLSTYFNHLSKIEISWFKQLLNSFEGLITARKTKSELFDSINDEIENLQKLLIIIIDDVDRLDHSEIIAVLKTIRNTANFKNTLYVIAYDREYIEAAIEKYNTHNNKKFIDKVINLEITLPSNNESDYVSFLNTLLKSSLPLEYQNDIREALYGSFSETSSILRNKLDSFRDAKRLANSIIFNSKKVIHDIHIRDYILLEFLKLKFPNVYNLLYKKTEDFLDTKIDTNTNDGYYILKDSPKKPHDEDRRKNVIYGSRILYEIQETDLKLSSYDSELISDILKILFPPYKAHSNKRNTINATASFRRYFRFELNENEISSQEFNSLINLDDTSLKSKIDEYIIANKEDSLIKHFKEFQRSTMELQVLKKIILGIFHLASQKSQYIRYNFEDIISFDVGTLLTKINLAYKLSRESGPEAEKNVELFIEELLKSSHPAFTSYFLYNTSKDRRWAKFPDSLPLPMIKIEEILTSNLEKQITEKKDLNHIWHYLHSCTKEKYEEIQPNSYHQLGREYFEAAITMVREYIVKEQLDNYILNFLNSPKMPKAKDILDGFGFSLFFKDLDDFRGAVEKSNSNYVAEFIEFLEHEGNSDFEFKIIPFVSNK